MLSKGFLNEEATYKLKKIVELVNALSRDDLIYKTGNKKKHKTYFFGRFKTIRSFGREVYNNDLSLDDTLEQQIRLIDDTNMCKESTKSKESFKIEKKLLTVQLYFLIEDKKF